MSDIPRDVHYELVNWMRWCFIGPWPHPLPATHCGSLESAYKAPPEWDMDLAEAPRSHWPINTRNAEKVQAVFEKLPDLERFVLLAEYPQRERRGRNISKQLAADRIGISLQGYDRYLKSAAAKVAMVFEHEDTN